MIEASEELLLVDESLWLLISEIGDTVGVSPSDPATMPPGNFTIHTGDVEQRLAVQRRRHLETTSTHSGMSGGFTPNA